MLGEKTSRSGTGTGGAADPAEGGLPPLALLELIFQLQLAEYYSQ